MKITVFVPTLNEESTISKVVKDFKKNKRVNNVIVYDAKSKDNTVINAKRAGAKVYIQNTAGKGNAIREIFDKFDSDVYVLVDGDDTYPSDSLNELVKPIIDDQADMVIGNRINRNSEKRAFSRLHKIGNKIISGLISFSFGKSLKDVLSGYRVLNKKAAKQVALVSKGFEIETELTIKSLINDFRLIEIPIKYRKRSERSDSKLSSFGDGYLIIYTIISMLRDYKPLFFFSLLSFFSGIFGLFLGMVVLEEWLRTGLIMKLPTAILSALMIFISIQFFTIGVILDALNKKTETLRNK